MRGLICIQSYSRLLFVLAAKCGKSNCLHQSGEFISLVSEQTWRDAGRRRGRAVSRRKKSPCRINAADAGGEVSDRGLTVPAATSRRALAAPTMKEQFALLLGLILISRHEQTF